MADGRAMLKSQSDHAALKLMVALVKLGLEPKYNPDQPRVPAGTPDGGQWIGVNRGTASGARSRSNFDKPRWVRTAQVELGSLVTQLGSGRDIRCVYRFDHGDVVVPGPILGGCPSITPSAAVVHGQKLNDNRKR
ncbi:hypothetical protein [Xanthobacter sediminis]